VGYITSVNTKFSQVQLQVGSLDARVAEMENTDYLQRSELQPVQKDIQQLSDRVGQYEQDIRVWNEQVDAMFGAANARYFRQKTEN
jgi:peptidoglycan hydrolase CwlO-like protein